MTDVMPANFLVLEKFNWNYSKQCIFMMLISIAGVPHYNLCDTEV